MRWGLVGALLTGSALLFLKLGAEGLWLDELFSVRAATQDIPGLLKEVGQDVHPPLYFLLLKGWLLGGTSDAWVRLPSALAVLGCVGLAWAIGRKTGGELAGTFSAFLVASAPAMIELGREARSNTMLAFLALLGLWCCLLRSRSAMVLYSLVAIALLYTHIFGAFVLLWHLLFLVGELKKPDLLKPWFGAWILAGLAFLPWAGQLSSQVTDFSEAPWYALPSKDSLGWLVTELAGGPGLAAAVMIGILLALQAGISYGWWASGLLALILVPQALSYGWAPILRARNVLPLWPAFLVMAGCGLARVPGVGAVVIAAFLLASAKLAWLEREREQWREAAQVVIDRWENGDVIEAVHPRLWDWYLPDNIYPEARGTTEGLGRLWVLEGHDLVADWDFKPEQLLLDKRFLGARVRLVDRGLQEVGIKEGGEAFYWNRSVVFGPLSMEGACGIGVWGKGDPAGGEAAKIKLRWLREGVQVGEEVLDMTEEESWLWTELVESHGEQSIELAFINDGVVGSEDRNVLVGRVQVKCRK